MQQEIETERRFLISKLPEDINNFPSKIIEDLRIETGEPHPHFRVRKDGDKMVLTKKYPKETGLKLQMIEETIVLTEIEYKTFQKLEGTKQSKIRFNYIYNDRHTELDVWTNDLEGLAIIEFEFSSKEEAETFVMPKFCLLEITDEEWLAGGMLSGKKYSDLADKLKNLGYSPINYKTR